MTTTIQTTKLVAPLSLSAMTDYLKGLGSQLTADDIGGDFKIVRKSDGVTVFVGDSKNFANRWACFLSNATNPKLSPEARGKTENVINNKGALVTRDEVMAHYEVQVTSWAPSSEFPQRAPNGSKGTGNQAPKVLGMLETLKLSQEKLNAELLTLQDQAKQLADMVAAKEKEIRRAAKVIAAYEVDDEDEEEAQDGELHKRERLYRFPFFLRLLMLIAKSVPLFA